MPQIQQNLPPNDFKIVPFASNLPEFNLKSCQIVQYIWNTKISSFYQIDYDPIRFTHTCLNVRNKSNISQKILKQLHRIFVRARKSFFSV